MSLQPSLSFTRESLRINIFYSYLKIALALHFLLLSDGDLMLLLPSLLLFCDDDAMLVLSLFYLSCDNKVIFVLPLLCLSCDDYLMLMLALFFLSCDRDVAIMMLIFDFADVIWIILLRNCVVCCINKFWHIFSWYLRNIYFYSYLFFSNTSSFKKAISFLRDAMWFLMDFCYNVHETWDGFLF